LFETCEPNDGAVTLSVFKGGGILATMDVVWKAKEKGDWELEVANAAGLPMVHMTRTGGKIETESKIDKLPKLAVLTDGFLAVNGEHIGVKASEVPCILGFRLPRSWMSLAREVETEGRVSTIHMGDERRELVTTVKDAAQDANAVCTRISWSRFLFFGAHLSWCQNPNAHGGPTVKRRMASLTGVDDYVLKWVSSDE
jgi:hypothetical protein